MRTRKLGFESQNRDPKKLGLARVAIKSKYKDFNKNVF